MPAPTPASFGYRPTISFELMPPRKETSFPAFWETVEKLQEFEPDFFSLTYGAAGQDRVASEEVLARLISSYPTLPIAHLTCVAASRENVSTVINEFLDAGVRSFLALRGDPPVDQPDWQPHGDDVRSAAELVALLREVEAIRALRHPSLALRSAVHPVTVAVATFPSGNPQAGTTEEQEIHRLWQKQQAGANFAITQVFYEAKSYISFVDHAREAGVRIPIVAGILPATDAKRLRRVEQLTGVVAPREFLDVLDACPDAASQLKLGVAYTASLAKEVLAAGAPGLHVYTFNKAEPTVQFLTKLNLTTQPTSSVKPISPNTTPIAS